MTRVQIGHGFELHVERFGPIDAPAVLLIRGTGADSSRWMPQVEVYHEHFNVIIFDNRGVGKSDTPPGMYTVAQMADDVQGGAALGGRRPRALRGGEDQLAADRQERERPVVPA